tara:strand:- start:187 stop:582 length:396 start_codon:yes stop_codon:yes gene_type:complete
MNKNYQYKTKVYYEDTDAGGIVYYANYLKFFERARTEMIYKQFGLKHQKLKEKFDIIFVVRACNIKYLKSGIFEDELTVITRIIKKSVVRLNLVQEVKRNNDLLVTAEIELAVINRKGLVQKLPEELLSAI